MPTTYAASERWYRCYADAEAAFSRQRARLLDVNRWGELSKGASVVLQDSSGRALDRSPQPGDRLIFRANGREISLYVGGIEISNDAARIFVCRDPNPREDDRQAIELRHEGHAIFAEVRGREALGLGAEWTRFTSTLLAY